MELVRRELVRHVLIINKVWDTLYSNPKHLRGVGPYKDKRKLYQLRDRVIDKRQLLRRKDFQFLERLLNKYSR